MTEQAKNTELQVRDDRIAVQPENSTSIIWKHGHFDKSFDLRNFSLSRLDKEILLAHASDKPKIHELDEAMVGDRITGMIASAIFDLGYNMDEEDEIVLIRRVGADILHHFSKLTLEEVDIAIKMGVRGRLGEFFGATTVTFFNFIDRYITEMKIPARTKFQQALPAPSNPEPSDEVKLQWHRHWTNQKVRAFREHAENSQLSISGEPYDSDAYYHYLNFVGLIKISNSDKAKMIDRARKKVILKLENKKVGKYERPIGEQIDMVKNGEDPDKESQIRSLARGLAVEKTLKGLLNKKSDLAEVFETAEKKKEFTVIAYHEYLKEEFKRKYKPVIMKEPKESKSKKKK